MSPLYNVSFLSLSCTDKICTKAQRIQNRALRLALKSHPHTPIIELHQNVNCMLFTARAKFNLLKLMFYRVRLEHVDIDRENSIVTRSTEAPTFLLPTPRNSRYQKSLHYQGGTLWNSLLTDLR